ncbi:hypothetical protein [Undibacterium sp. TJN19]|uniref:hypothetical protein n=1 Tax=Undibacterium sp. TJN19 TaxID=3413055 RepID=UPI003BF22F5E
MEAIAHFSLEKLPSYYPMREYKRRLLFKDSQTAIIVHGDEVAAQFSCADWYVVMTQYDYFDGTSHWFYLIDKQLRRKDACSPPDSFGFLQDVEFVADACIQFGFYGSEQQWSLAIVPQGFWSLRGKRYLRLNRV